MPSYVYTARDSSGDASSGTIVADTVNHAQQLLRAQGHYPTSIRAATEAELNPPDADAGMDDDADIKLSRAEVIHVAYQLSIMIETGVTLSEALDCIAAQAERPPVRAVVEDLS